MNNPAVSSGVSPDVSSAETGCCSIGVEASMSVIPAHFRRKSITIGIDSR